MSAALAADIHLPASAPAEVSVWTLQESSQGGEGVSGACPGSEVVTLSRAKTHMRLLRWMSFSPPSRQDFLKSVCTHR